MRPKSKSTGTLLRVTLGACLKELRPQSPRWTECSEALALLDTGDPEAAAWKAYVAAADAHTPCLVRLGKVAKPLVLARLQ